MDAIGGNDYGYGAFGAFFEEWAGGGVFFLCAVGVGELHWAGAQDLEAVVEVGGWGEGLGAEGGAGVVDFNEGDWVAVRLVTVVVT